MDIFTYLQNNSYPGRGIIVGRYNDEVVVAYFIMGRSTNSRNRIFVKEDKTIYTKAFDETMLEDPSLIIYNAIREFDNNIIVTNGNQTDTIYDYLKQNKTFKDALDTREYEPDNPNYTARISALVNGDGNYQLSILKRENNDCKREYYSYKAKNNTGHFISTYDHDGNPLPSFSGSPMEIEIRETFDEFCDKLWNSLNSENRISLYVRYGDKEKIINRNEELS